MAASCPVCRSQVAAKATYCSARCRKAASRARNAPVVELPVAEVDESLASVVRAELESADRLATSKGRAALALAVRIDKATAVMGYAALVKQWEATMDAALAGTQRNPDSSVLNLRDELAARRQRGA